MLFSHKKLKKKPNVGFFGWQLEAYEGKLECVTN